MSVLITGGAGLSSPACQAIDLARMEVTVLDSLTEQVHGAMPSFPGTPAADELPLREGDIASKTGTREVADKNHHTSGGGDGNRSLCMPSAL